MEVLARKYKNFKKSYDALNKVIALQELYRESKSNEINYQDMDDALSAAVIQHFEITYETVWKLLKQYLADIHDIEMNSPKMVFRACHTYGILPETITNELITLADARNTSTHIYNQVLAKEVRNSIVRHHQVLGTIVEKMSSVIKDGKSHE